MKMLLPVAVIAALAGCCPMQKAEPKGELLPAVSSADQLARINQRSALVQSLRAKGKVTITYVDKEGRQHTDAADGSLVLRRRTWQLSDKDGTDVYYDVVLFGRVANQDVFELGENKTNAWMAVRVDPKVAHVARKKFPVEVDPADPEAGAMPILAGQIPELLGIAPVRDRALPVVVMTNSENIEVLTQNASGGIWPISVLELSRYSPGDPAAIRLYRPDGIIEGEAKLSEYREVKQEGPATRALPSVRLPHRISVDYPARKAHIELEINTADSIFGEGYELNPNLKDAIFMMQDFEAQGLKVNPGGK